ncbi:hypothetical protein BBO99_00005082 [Phytophthora kernoviae]|uniref:Sugar transporter SWEET1 n=2 Tax=Phytophthora kernoviae TaxID=325452 RepID=A0A421F4X9_9STRA|nr:hypothetical protein G195_005541 [Phytophthora kernoviae 00238/432]KAG2523527.1 hypothetical protein JM16_004791 [Phytophthora kernoviae]KAG2525376.1 hypothetical protein JM18_004404 [Phytophthora kernoviae]RLN21428.1 hypothetical protein BBI17_005169 [Phytophthora kernoviae]RLN79681.1 hypothetical protein BBO99_00005082 [Phytophthora kernoviae]
MGVATVLLAAATGIAELVFKLSPIPDIYNVNRCKSIGEMAELPIITLIVNSNVWTWYGLATDSIFPLFVTQVIGQLFGVVFNIVYFRWSPPDKRKRLLKMYAYAFAIYCVVDLYCILGLVGTLGMTKDELGTSLGYVGVMFSTALFMSPLGTLKRVIEMKSAASIPINMSVMVALSCGLWVATGLVDSDWFVVGVNTAGVLLGCIQIVLYRKYKPGRYDGAVLPDTDKELSVIVVSPKNGYDGFL